MRSMTEGLLHGSKTTPQALARQLPLHRGAENTHRRGDHRSPAFPSPQNRICGFFSFHPAKCVFSLRFF